MVYPNGIPIHSYVHVVVAVPSNVSQPNMTVWHCALVNNEEDAALTGKLWPLS